MTVTDDLMMRISLLGDGNAWPSTIELINDLADRIEALTAENERLSYALGCIANEDWKDMTVGSARDLARAALGEGHD